jgi:serine/threonine-protein kinase
MVLVALAQCAYGFPLLPERMASHFAPSGMPNGWMTKSQFVVVYALTLLPALMVEFWVARRIAKMDGAKLNLPNKEYWLAPERRESTFSYFEDFFAWYGCVFLLVIVFVMGLAMRANLNPPPRLPTGPVLSALAAFTAFNIAAIVVILRRFSR